MKSSNLLPLGLLAATSPALGQFVIDGSISGDPYTGPLSVQAVETQFGDNFSELNAAYGVISGGKLHLALTGNLEANFNKLEIFIDSVPGGENVFSGVPGNDGSARMAPTCSGGAGLGLVFDAGFEADYHLIARRGNNGTSDVFDLDIAVLGTPSFTYHADVFGGASEGSGVTGTGPGNAFPIGVGYDNSNVAGILGGCAAADGSAAQAVTTGLEFAIDLADLGGPAGAIKVLAFVNGSDHNFVSNQFLGPLAAPQCNLGGDGAGNFTGCVDLDLGAFAGDQSFTVGPDPCDPTNEDPLEDNDTCETALPLDNGSYVDLFAVIGDDDYYRFVVCPGETFLAQTFFTHADGDLDLTLTDVTEGCPGTLLTGSTSVTDNEQVVWMNPGPDPAVVVLRSYVWSGSSSPCNTYGMFIAGHCGIGDAYCGPGVQNPNSTGQIATLHVSGSPLASDDELNLTATGMPAGETGYFVWSTSSGLVDLPALNISDGFLCLGSGKGRFNGAGPNQGGVLVSSPGGSFSLTAIDTGAMPQSSQAPIPILAGLTGYFQGWYRDIAGVNGNNFTDAVSYTWQ